jgi:ferredoxin
LFEGDDIIYLPQDSVISVDQEVKRPASTALPSQVVEHFIKKAKHHWIMNFCICRESMDCQDYPQELGCLFLGEGTLDINPTLGRRVTKEEALEHVRKCREAGLVHMIGRNKLDKQWLGVKEGDKLLSICNCCPCCCLWRIAPVLDPRIGQKVKKMPGVEVKVSEECIDCGTCTRDICFVEAIHLKEGKAFIDENCKGCGRCVDACPQGAIKIVINNDSFVEESIKKIDKLVDLT